MCNIKKVFSILLTVAIIVCALPLTSLTASAITYSGTCGENLTYSFDSTTKQLTILGSGDMTDYSLGLAPWNSYSSQIEKVELSDQITSIGKAAFYYCTNLTEINLPNSIKTINFDAFYSCHKLAKIEIPSSVTDIGYGAFMDCRSLTEITIPNNVESIGDNIFCDCSGLLNVELPNTLSVIPAFAFENCTNLKSFTIPNSVTSINPSAFKGCTNLTTIKLSDDLTKICESAFRDCTSLSEITFPAGITFIGQDAFLNCTELKTVNNYSNLPIVGGSDFGWAGKYADVINWYGTLSGSCGTNSNFILIAETGLLTISGTQDVQNYPWGICNMFVKEAVVSEGITSLTCSAFFGCNNLSKVTLPNSLRTITDYAFYGCTSLSEITIPDGATYISNFVFYDCTNLQEVTLPRSVTHIGSSAFLNCSNLTLKVYKNSYAHQYAIDNNIPYEIIKDFSDVSSSGWYYTAVKFVTDNGYFTGYSNSDKFGTADNIQRQDFVVALARLDGVNLDAYSGSTSFADVPKGSYYAKAVQWASQNGIVTGYSHNNKFGVGDNITREQLVTMFYRYIKNYKGEDVSVSGNAAAGYPDYSKVSVFSKDAVDWAIAKGVISGKNGNIAPVANAQRCEVATIIYNMFQNGILHE